MPKIGFLHLAFACWAVEGGYISFMLPIDFIFWKERTSLNLNCSHQSKHSSNKPFVLNSDPMFINYLQWIHLCQQNCFISRWQLLSASNYATNKSGKEPEKKGITIGPDGLTKKKKKLY